MKHLFFTAALALTGCGNDPDKDVEVPSAFEVVSKFNQSDVWIYEVRDKTTGARYLMVRYYSGGIAITPLK